MKVFISWSGERSKAVAQAWHDWLPNVIQAVEPWMSETDIAKGARWGMDMARELDETRVGIICLTPENLNAPWILFEAGALSKTLEETYVCPYLFDVRPADLEGPLAQFQAAIANEEGTKKLVQTINRALGEEALTEERANETFEVWWPQLQERLASVSAAEGEQGTGRSDREILEAVLVSIREVERQVVKASQRDAERRGEAVDRMTAAYSAWRRGSLAEMEVMPIFEKLLQELREEENDSDT